LWQFIHISSVSAQTGDLAQTSTGNKRSGEEPESRRKIVERILQHILQ
jgi:hypothetical protein